MSNSSGNEYKDILDLFKREYSLVGNAKVRVWHAWLFFGVIMGFAMGVALVVQRGNFELSTAQSATPELPRVYVNTTYPTLSPTRTLRSVQASCGTTPNCTTSLQAAIDAASLGDEIVVDSGMTINGPVTLRNKTSGSGWIVIRTSNPAGIPSVGSRVNNTHASAMPNIISPGGSVKALGIDDGAHHYRLVGLEFYNAPTYTNTLIELGNPDATSLSQQPSNIVLDRVYAHGGAVSAALTRCVALHGSNLAVIDSYISGCKHNSADAQAIGGWNGPGPYKITNNYLEAAGENLMFGGSRPGINGVIQSDIEIRGNYFFKPLTWKVGDPSYAGNYWVVKNLFELKSAKRVLIDGNIFENNWSGQGQDGSAIVLKSNSASMTCSWCETAHVTFTNNIVKNAVNGFQFSVAEGGDDVTNVPVPMNNILIRNVLVDNISNRLFAFGSPSGRAGDRYTIQNVTGFTRSMIIIGSDGNVPMNNFVFSNNIVQRPIYGVGAGAEEGIPHLNAKFPGYTFTNNLLVNTRLNSSGGLYISNSSLVAKYPAGTRAAALMDGVGFVNWQARDYRLAASSPYYGQNLGADFNSLNAATANTITGTGTAPTPTPTPPPTPTPTATPGPTPTPTSAPTPTPTTTPAPTPTPPTLPNEVIVDNASASGVTITGEWTISTYTAGYYGSNYIHDAKTGKGSKSVRFTPSISAAANYQVYVRWINGDDPDTSRANNVPVTVTHSGGTSNYSVNQQLQGEQWVLLGTHYFNTGTSGNVLISNTGTSTSQYVIVDAVRFVPVPTEVIKDNADTTGVTITGSWPTSTLRPGYYGINYIHDGKTGKGSKSVRFTPNIAVAGSYNVYARWLADPTFANNVPVTVTHAGGTANYIVNQRVNGGQWVLLGTHQFSAGSLGNVLISNTGTSTSSNVIVDAVRFEPVP